MSRAGRDSQDSRGRRRFAVVSLLVLAPGTNLLAAPVRPAVEARQQLRQFWAAGPDRWAVTDPLPRFPSIRLISNPDGSLRDNRLVDAIDWRRARNIDQFDRRYFRISPVFERQDAREAAAASAVTAASSTRQYLVTIAMPRSASMQVLVPPTESDVTTAEQNLGGDVLPTPAPEPASWASVALLFAAGGWWGRRARRRRP